MGTEEEPRVADESPVQTTMTGRPEIFPLPAHSITYFAQSRRHAFGWWKDRRGVVAFGVRKGGVFGRTVATFALTEEGWAEAWNAIESLDPALASAVAARLADIRRRQDVARQVAAERVLPAAPPASSAFTSEQIARSAWYRARASSAMALASLLGLSLLVACAVVCSRQWFVFHLNRAPWWPALVILIVVSGLVFSVPIVAARAFIHFGPARAVGLSTGTTKSWWRRSAATFALALCGQVIVGTIVFAVVRDAPSWWLVLWGVLAILVVVRGALFTPLAFDFGSRRASVPAEVRDRAEVLAHQMGVRLPRVVLLERRTSQANNAFVAGLGPFRRMFVTESLFTMDQARIDVVLAHELAHVRNRDVESTTALRVALQIVPVGFIAALVSHHGAPVRIGPATYPLLFIYVLSGSGISALLSVPLRRRQEERADRDALAITGDPASFKSLVADLAVANFDDLAERRQYGGGMSRVHQTPVARIAMANDAMTTGAPTDAHQEHAPSAQSQTVLRSGAAPWAPAPPGRYGLKVGGRILLVCSVAAAAAFFFPEIHRRALLETQPICFPAVSNINTLQTSPAVTISIDGYTYPGTGRIPVQRLGTAPFLVVALRSASDVPASHAHYAGIRPLGHPLTVMLTTGCYFSIALTTGSRLVAYSNATLSTQARSRFAAYLDPLIRRTPIVASVTFVP